MTARYTPRLCQGVSAVRHRRPGTAADLDSDRLGFSERIRLRLPLPQKGFRKLWRTYHGCSNFSRVRHRQATRRRFDGAEAQRLQRLF